jgi:aminoglycoside phosphotransferase (APT) family kinase protein
LSGQRGPDAVPEGPDGAIDKQVVGRRLAIATGDPEWQSFRAILVAGGKSNLTYELRSGAGSLILRRPPTGALLPTAHDMGREARVQRALASSDVPVPRIVHLDADGRDFGVPYYVMEKVDGAVVRDQFPAGLADAPADRSTVAEALVATLVALHQVVPQEVGLADFGRPAGFMRRQVSRWADQWQRSMTREVAEVDRLVALLGEVDFPEAPGAIVHGDYRLDNCLLRADLDRPIAAVLDWELSTLGDPLADVGMLLFYWTESGEPLPVLTPAITSTSGFPTRREVAERYFRDAKDRSDILPAYVAFAHLKFAVIAQGIAQRTRAGAMAGQDFGDLDDEVVRIATQGLERFDNKEV